MKHDIGKFVLTKSFCNKPEDIPKKFLFAFIELGHPSEVCKKGESEEEIAEELMDVIFRVLDDNRLACRKVNTTEMLDKRLEKNLARPLQYREGHREKLQGDS